MSSTDRSRAVSEISKSKSRLRCTQCGAVLDDSRLDGLCPRCTWGFLTDTEGEERHSPIHSLLAIPGLSVAEEIARGGMGIVYLARQAKPERVVALKMLLPQQVASEEMRERFRLEVQTIAALEHPSILPVYEVGEHNGLPYFTMKYASRGTLLQKKEELSGRWREIAMLVAALAEAVQFAHERGVLHRDLKPGNILFDEENRAYVSDFGLAKLVTSESDLTRSIAMLGTPHYVAPEIASHSAKNATTASDIYSLGAVLYELLAGRPPFDAEGVPALLRKIAETEAVPPSEIWKERNAGAALPRDLEVIALKCLAKEPRRRYGTARELAEDLRRWLEGKTILARAPTGFERVRAWTRRNPALASVSAALVIVLAGVMGLEMRSARRLKSALAQSLLAQARMSRATGRAGQRFETLALVSRAAEYQLPKNDSEGQKRVAALRSEAVGALSVPDLRVVSRWPVPVSHFENEFDFTRDLGSYVVGNTNGGFALIETGSGRTVWETDGDRKNPVVELHVTGNGKWIAATYQNGRVELHCTSTNGPVRTWRGQADEVRLCAFSEQDDKFVVGILAENGIFEVRVIGLNDGKSLAVLPSTVPLTSVAFNPSGDRLAVSGDRLTVWKLATSSEMWSAPLSHNASAMAWSGDGRRIAVALDRRLQKSKTFLKGNPILIFDAEAGEQESIFSEETERVERLAFHPDGRSLAAASWSGDLVWGSVQPEGFRLRIPAMQRMLAFSPDGKRLAYSPSKEELGFLEVTQAGVIKEWNLKGAPERVSCTMSASLDGKWLAAGGQSYLRLWDIQKQVEVAALKLPENPWYMQVLFGPENKSIYYSALSFGVRRVELWGVEEGGASVRFGKDEQLKGTGFMAIGYASDGRSVIAGETDRRLGHWTMPLKIWLWPEGNVSAARTLAEGVPMIGYRAIPGGKWGVTTDLMEPDLWIWDFKTRERIRNLGIPKVVSSEPTADGRWLITRAHEEFAVWEVGTWRKVSHWSAPEEAASATMIASPDSRMLACGTPDGRLVLRRIPEGTEVVTLTPPQRLRPADWIFSRDSQRIFIMLQTSQIWEWDLANLRHQLGELGLAWK